MTAFIVANGDRTKFRAWGDLGPTWVSSPPEALQFARRCDAEAFAREDEDAWAILPIEALDRWTAVRIQRRIEENADWHRRDGSPDFERIVRDLARLLAVEIERGAFNPDDSCGLECHGLDTPGRVCFYEQDFYVLSNFSSFNVTWAGRWRFQTSEHCYHWLKFATGAANGALGGADVSDECRAIAKQIMAAPSAHEAFKIAERHGHLRRPDWYSVRVDFMGKILRQKVREHEYVRRKLLATGDRELVENSWRDPFWGWGPNRDGKNMLGKLWMEIRAELRGEASK